MSDSFADLWNSTAPSKPAPPPQKLGSVAQSQGQAPRRQQSDVFALLSSTGSSQQSISRGISPRPSSGASNGSKTATTASSGDAFSNLFSGSLASGSNGANMTMAERAAKAEQDRRDKAQQSYQAAQKEASAWNGLDTLMSKPSAKTVPSTNGGSSVADDWDLAFNTLPATKASVPSKSQKQPQPPQDDDDWGLGDFSSAPPTTKAPTPKSKPTSSARQMIWEMDDFNDSEEKAPPLPQRRHSPPRTKTASPSRDFDFGSREDNLLGNESDDNDDVLGSLGKPVSTTAKSRPARLESESPSPPRRPSPRTRQKPQAGSRSSSPPPHIIGQIVEMGFTPQQARIALAATDTGLDVQAALETLLSNTDNDRERQDARPRDAPNQRQKQRRRPSPSPPRDEPSPGSSIQTDKIIAQASEIGTNLFNKANAFWASGKEKALRAYEERTKANAAQQQAASSGRPRWMQDAPEEVQKEAGIVRERFADEERPRERFADDDDGSAKPPQKTSRRPDPPPQASKPQPQTVDLFSSEPVAYVSPFRRKRPQPSAAASAAPSPPKPSTPRAPSPLVERNTISAPPSAIANSAKHKATGGEKFKLGQYADAETAYGLALDCLPDGHLLRVPLYNNRALARLKTGDYSGVTDDTTAVIELIGTGYHPHREARVTREDHGASVDLGDALVKAWRRRAEAAEGRERWEAAQKDWEAIASVAWASASARNDAVRGAGRCRRLVAANSGGEGQSASAPPAVSRPPVSRPKPKPRPPISEKPSVALANLKAAGDAQEAEDNERADLKDKVDARIMAWKGGKETNLRALLASLDNVLWPELGWTKIGMAEVVTPSQVKVKYTRAIAKVHPDKLNAGNTTVEQRMIANGVFGGLNEAWNAFKQ